MAVCSKIREVIDARPRGAQAHLARLMNRKPSVIHKLLGQNAPEQKDWPEIEYRLDMIPGTLFQAAGRPVVAGQVLGALGDGRLWVVAEGVRHPESVQSKLERLRPATIGDVDDLRGFVTELESALLAQIESLHERLAAVERSGDVVPFRQRPKSPPPAAPGVPDPEQLPEAAHRKKGRGPTRRPNPPIGGDD